MDNLRALEAQGSMAVQAATPVLRSLAQDSSAPAVIQAGDFNYMKGIAVDSGAATGGTRSVGPMATGSVLEYILKVPVTGVYTITYRVAGNAPGAIAFRLNGQTLATTEPRHVPAHFRFRGPARQGHLGRGPVRPDPATEAGRCARSLVRGRIDPAEWRLLRIRLYR